MTTGKAMVVESVRSSIIKVEHFWMGSSNRSLFSRRVLVLC